MSFFDISNLIMSGEKIFNIPLRVCFYARVSTDSDMQMNSLMNQRNYYENYIKSISKWVFVKGYIDESISGVSVLKRNAFKQMIFDAKKKKFDLIITKEVSRFARDLEDSIHYIRLLKDNNVGVFFENQNINTFDVNSELILNIMFNLAQDESRKLSSRIKFGHNEAIKKEHVLGSSNILGYKKDNCKLVIVAEEAKIIKKIFELYASGKYGLSKLAKKLGELGFYNKRGNLYDKDTLKRIIENPKYKGFYRGKTTEIVDYRTKKRIKIEKNKQVIHKCDKNIIPPIVSISLWDKANSILSSRKKDKNNNSFISFKYPLSSKIICSEHNTKYQRSRNRNRSTWCCGLYLQYRLDACISPIIPEIDLYAILLSIMNDIISNKNDIINKMINIYRNIYNDYDDELTDINKQIIKIEDKKRMALDLVFNGEIDKCDLINQFDNYKNEINNLNNRRNLILEQRKIFNNNDEILINGIKNELDGGLLEGFIREFVNKIVVFKINNERHNIRLDIYLNTVGCDKSNIIFNSLDKKRKNKYINNYIYNIFYKQMIDRK